jgi:hypothetical protein
MVHDRTATRDGVLGVEGLIPVRLAGIVVEDFVSNRNVIFFDNLGNKESHKEFVKSRTAVGTSSVALLLITNGTGD